MPGREIRTNADFEHAVRALSSHFGTDIVYVVGSQAIIPYIGDLPDSVLRRSLEIDAYPGNAQTWEAANHSIASEEVNALFGYASQFEMTHGFHVDGVDASTAILPPEWRERARAVPVDAYGKVVHAIVPAPTDPAASKLARLSDKDRAFVQELLKLGLVEPKQLMASIDLLAIEEDRREAARQFLASVRPTSGIADG